MRRTPALILLACSSLACADRLIDIPIAHKVAIDDFRLETQFAASHASTERYYLATGLTKNIDIELHTEQISPDPLVATFDIGYNFQPPLVDLSPGLSVGVQDALNTTKDGRRAYGVVTFRQGLETSAANAYVDASIGIRVGSHTYPFVGVNLPVAERVNLLVEHNGLRISAGMEVRPIPVLGLRLIFQEHDTLLSAQFSHKFKG